MKRFASIVALALFVPLTASASPDERASSTHKPKSEELAKRSTKKSEPKKKPSLAPQRERGDSKVASKKKDPARGSHATAGKIDDFGHGEPKVTHGVRVVSTRHTEPPTLAHAGGVSRGHHGDRKPLPLLPASATSKLDRSDAETRPAEKKPQPAGNAPSKGHEAVKKAEPEKKGHAAPSGHGNKKPEHPKAAQKDPRKAENQAPRAPCFKDAVEVVRGAEIDRFSLQRCEGGLAPFAVERLSVLLRPGNVARPLVAFDTLAKGKPESPGKAKTQKPADKAEDLLGPAIKRVDPGLVERLELLTGHFAKPGHRPRVSLVSGVRPNSTGSLHSHGRAMDIRIEGVSNEELVAFCKSIPDTGCGYYPNSSFVHVDVRDPGAGHVSWIDASGPGETPRYVAEWPARGGSEIKGDATQGGESAPEPEVKAEASASASASAPAPNPCPKAVKLQEMIDGVRD